MQFTFDPYAKFTASKLAVAFVVSNTRIAEAETMVEKHKKFFETEVFEVMCTSVTERRMDKILGRKITHIPSDKLGGAEVVASKIVQGQVDVLILLIDELEEYQPHMVSIDCLKRTAGLFMTQVVTSELTLECLIDNCSYPFMMQELL